MPYNPAAILNAEDDSCYCDFLKYNMMIIRSLIHNIAERTTPSQV